MDGESDWEDFLRAWACSGCGSVEAYDYVACACGENGRREVQLSGRGTVWSTTSLADRGEHERRPIVLVTSEEHPHLRFLGAWSGADTPMIGTPVELVPLAAQPGSEPLPCVRLRSR
jgi:uncharacterized OB-fold protein